MITTTDYCNQTLVTDLIATNQSGFNGVLSNCQVGLYASPVALSNETITSELTPVSFPGYAAQSISWSAAYSEADDSISLVSEVLEFHPTANPTSAVSCAGYYVYTIANSQQFLLFAENFAEPIVIDDAMAAAVFVVNFNYGSTTLSPGSVHVL